MNSKAIYKDSHSLYLQEYIHNQIKSGIKEINIPKDRYFIRSQYCPESYVKISNNDNGLRHIFLHLENEKDISIDWQGATLLFQGVVIPFFITNCQNITFKNFTIDWVEDHHLEISVKEKMGYLIRFTILNRCLPILENGNLFCTSNLPMEPQRAVLHFMNIDPLEKEPGKNCQEIWINDDFHVKKEGDDLSIVSPLLKDIKLGSSYILENHFRPAPAIVLDNSKEIKLFRGTVHYALGMAVLAQFCDSITIKEFNVIPSEERMISTLADAFHFVQCRGAIEVSDSICYSQMDDAINVHGVYTKVNEVISKTECLIEVSHHQQFGNDFAVPEDKIAFYNKDTFKIINTAEVVETKRINQYYTYIRWDNPVFWEEGNFVVENLSSNPDVLVYNNRFDHNRARNLLVTTSGKVHIHHNYFRSGGSAIRISGDTKDWYESGSVRNVMIEDNIFDKCNYSTKVWGDAVLDIGPDMSISALSEAFHENITIRNNHFKDWNRLGILGRYIKGLLFEGNTCEKTEPFIVQIKCVDEEKIVGANLEIIREES